jgi:ABC-type uncharacterized transport system involved in gliding motility auxiliary subunit
MKNTSKNKNSNTGLYLGLLTLFLMLALLFARAVFPEVMWATIVVLVLLLGDLVYLIVHNQAALRSRTAAFGLNSLITILLVLGLLGVTNFLVSKYPKKIDLTRGKLNTLSDQTVKTIQGLTQPLKAALFIKTAEKEQYRPLMDNFKSLSQKFEVEYVDPDREPTRAKNDGVKKYGTLELSYEGRNNKVDEPTEEKITNAIIKLTKNKSSTLCAITGHGEKSFSSVEAEGYDGVKKALANQSYEVKDLNIVQEQNKIPDTCDAIAVVGPTKSFFAPEIQALQAYLENGGRAVFALDTNIQGAPYAPELLPVLEAWNLKPDNALIVDPVSRLFGVDASVPIILEYNKQSPVTKDATEKSYFPFARPIEAITTTPELTTRWLAKSTAKSWGVVDLKSITKGEAEFKEGRDMKGPLIVAASTQGKLKNSKATRETRVLLFGTSFLATNNFARYGGNLDFFLNSVAWALEDESMISIHAKEEGPGRVEMSQKTAVVIFLVTVVLVPLAIAIAGIVIWVFRRRL